MAPVLKLIVVDASVALKWQFDDEEYVAQALMLRDDFFLKGVIQVIAPHLLVYELTNGITVASRKKRISPDRANEMLNNLLALGVELRNIEPLSALELALMHNISAYDAAYLSLAKSENCELWTGDRVLHQSLKDKQVKWIGDYLG
jgi:predicted nucleic acid-binding protein